MRLRGSDASERETWFDHHLVKPIDLLLLESVLVELTQQADDGGAA